MTKAKIPFNKPFTVGTEFLYIQQAIDNGWLSGNGQFTKQCQSWLTSHINCKQTFLTSSCTDALEMSAILMNIQPGDEVIMPSFTFVSTANAFVLRGATPIFVDIRDDTLNLDERKIEVAITPRTKAIVPVHYAGVPCEMDTIMSIAQTHNIWVVEDAAHAISSTYKDRKIGSIGHLATLSFHETKNVICGEGGALLVNHSDWVERAEIIWEKGTNRSQFFRGEVNKYTWIDVGSSFLPNEMSAAFLWAQLECVDSISRRRQYIWNYYHEAFFNLECNGLIRRPIIPDNCQHNAHLYYLLLSSVEQRNVFIRMLGELGVHTVFHYIPLHLSEAGQRYCRTGGDLNVTENLSDRLVRLPLWVGMTPDMIDYIIDCVHQVVTGNLSQD